MDPRNSLPKSVFVLSFMYYAMAMALFSLLPPDALSVYHQALNDPSDLPYINALNAIFVQAGIFSAWTIPALLVLVALLAASIFAVLVLHWIKQHLLEKKKEPSGIYRGVSLSSGKLAAPSLSSGPKPPVRIPDLVITNSEQEFINRVFAFLQSFSDTYSGHGHGNSLIEHTLNVMEHARSYQSSDPDNGAPDRLLILCAAAHDLGKAITFKKESGRWVSIGKHDEESAKIIATFPEWFALPEKDRELIRLSVKYYHRPQDAPVRFPGFSQEDLHRLNMLIGQLRRIDGIATKHEKKNVLSTQDISKVLFESFLNTLPELYFQTPSLAKNFKAIGWRVGKRVYLLESLLREKCLENLDFDLNAALGGKYRSAGKTSRFTEALLKALDQEGWLVKSLDEHELPAEQALWDIQAGRLHFNACIILDVPKAFHYLLGDETSYSIVVKGPHRPPISLTGKSNGQQAETMPAEENAIYPGVDTTYPSTLTLAITATGTEATQKDRSVPKSSQKRQRKPIKTNPTTKGEAQTKKDSFNPEEAMHESLAGLLLGASAVEEQKAAISTKELCASSLQNLIIDPRKEAPGPSDAERKKEPKPSLSPIQPDPSDFSIF